MDLLVTSEGRRQAAYGQLNVKYATFTDYHVFYESSGSLGYAEDATDRIMFESSNRYQDVVIPELEPGTTSVAGSFKTEDLIVAGASIASGTFSTGILPSGPIPLSGSTLMSARGRLLEGITKNFKDQRILSTEDTFSTTTGFKINHPLSGTFRHPRIHNREDFYNEAGRSGRISVDSSPSIFRDIKTSHLPNFKFLPPINSTLDPEVPGDPLGVYANLNSEQILTIEDLNSHLESKEMIEIDFEETSLDNNILAQMFEFANGEIQKLSIIDFGSFPDTEFHSPDKHVYFIGKIRRDSGNTDTFINLFTVVFD